MGLCDERVFGGTAGVCLELTLSNSLSELLSDPVPPPVDPEVSPFDISTARSIPVPWRRPLNRDAAILGTALPAAGRQPRKIESPIRKYRPATSTHPSAWARVHRHDGSAHDDEGFRWRFSTVVGLQPPKPRFLHGPAASPHPALPSFPGHDGSR